MKFYTTRDCRGATDAKRAELLIADDVSCVGIILCMIERSSLKHFQAFGEFVWLKTKYV